MKLSLLLISLFSFAAISKDFKPNMEELKLNKIKETKKSYSAGESVPYKRASNASRLSNVEVKGVTNTNREQNLKRYIEVNKEESEDSTTIKLSLNYLEPKLKDPNKYKIKSVNYHFGDGNIQNTALANVNGEDFITLDISSLSVGSYTASIELVIQKNEDLRASGNKNKSGSDFKPILLTYTIEFEKVDSAFLVVNEYLRPEGLWAIGLDLSESFSEGGEILNYKVETLFEGELDFSATITFNRFSISFNQVGEWKIIITMTDSLGDTDTKELIYNVTNARPRLEYTYTFNEELQGAIDIDMSASSDDGGEIVEYASFFLNDGQFSNYDSHRPKVTRLLLRSGINRVCLRIVDNNGVDRVSCFNVEFNKEILPIYYFNGIEETDFDPRFYFVDNACVIPDGRELKEFVIEYNNGVDFREVRTQEEYFDLFIPGPGTWNLTAYCLDSNNVQSNIVNYELNAEFDLGKPEAYVELGPLPFEEDPSQKIYATTWENSMPSPFANFITQYNYRFKNLNSGETFSVNRELAYGDIFFPSYGTWEVTYSVVDDLDLVSDPYVFTVDVVRPLIAPVLNGVTLQNQNGDDPASLNYRITALDFSEGSAPITEYIFNLNKENSSESFSINAAQPYVAINFPSFGTWTLETKLKNGDNLFSNSVFQTINIEKALPTLSISLNPLAEDITGLVYALSVDSFSTGSGSSITSYDFNFVETNKDLSFNLITASRFNDVTFPDGGNWTISYSTTNDLGDSSELKTLSLNVVKVNFPPVARFDFSVDYNSPKTLIVNSQSSDPEGELDKYIFKAISYQDGTVIEKTIENAQANNTFAIDLDYGPYGIDIIAVDKEGLQSDTFSRDYELIDPTPIGSFSTNLNPEDWQVVALQANTSITPIGFISNYTYSAVHESGEIVTSSTTSSFSTITLQLEGQWIIELSVMNNFGIISESVYQTVNLTDPNIAPIADVSFKETEVFGQYKLINNSIDEDGTISKVTVSGSNELGDTINEEFNNFDNAFININKANWNLEVIAYDDKNKASEPIEINIDLSNIEDFISIEITETGLYERQIDLSKSIFSDLQTLNLKVLRDNTEIYFDTINELVITLPIFNINATYIVIVESYNSNGTVLNKEITFDVILPNINGDTIPNSPGLAGYETLEGIDSDGDGVRDDIELYINSKNPVPSLREYLYKIANLYKNQLIQIDDKEQFLELDSEEDLIEECMNYYFGQGNGNKEIRRMKAKYFNTRLRLTEWSKSLEYTHGKIEKNGEKENAYFIQNCQ